MALAGKPVVFTRVATNPQPGLKPAPLVVIGTLPVDSVAAATTTANGTVKKAATQADFAGADITALKAELNAWLVKLKAAGIQA